MLVWCTWAGEEVGSMEQDPAELGWERILCPGDDLIGPTDVERMGGWLRGTWFLPGAERGLGVRVGGEFWSRGGLFISR